MTATGQALWAALVPPSASGQDDRCLVAARGVRLTTAAGRSLLCATSGLWNANLGYGNEAIAAAVNDAMLEGSYLGVFRYENHLARAAAEGLVDLAGPGHFAKVIFSTSGGAANDLVMKVVRQFHQLRSEPRRRLVIGLRNGYHGLTFGSFGLTDDDLGHHVYGVDRSLVRHVEPNDVAQLERLLDRQGHAVAGMVLEPLQGTGAVALDPEYVRAVAELADQHGFLLVADEVATGFHRVDGAFASGSWPRRPDLLVSSKGLTNGTCAAAAVLLSERVVEPFVATDAMIGHAETQAGTAVSCAAMVATMAESERLDATGLSRRLSGRLDAELARLVGDVPEVAGVTGAGCFRSVRMTSGDGSPLPAADVPRVVESIRRAGAVVHPGPEGFQLVPALTYTDDEVAELFETIRVGLGASARGTRSAVA